MNALVSTVVEEIQVQTDESLSAWEMLRKQCEQHHVSLKGRSEYLCLGKLKKDYLFSWQFIIILVSLAHTPHKS